ncbi:hypothetical protein BOTBODRAFT_144888 [Botryobasidium botryosum FD-172 SS1]|uniref:F-box domain-containing protein n=1 Tax=Botryobasidium botryosum (strain FD-172 SS1) TaxID=930990 RepID=A0A067MWF3_BOTB1|nr:hypothetical protein BOTBODRAFT_144888 [Botryobasidium botryosum FD-172 SS1]
MSLAIRLNFDVLSVIYSMLDTRSLLSLAITSRSMRDAIIPRFLYICVRLKNESSTRSFHRCLLSGGTAVGCVVRYFEFSFVIAREPRWEWEPPTQEIAGMLGEMLEQMDKLRSVKLDLYHGDILSNAPRFYRALVSQTSLLDLTLEHPYYPISPSPLSLSFADLREVKPLRSFHVTSSSYGPVLISSDSDFGAILLKSRDTLEELTLPFLTWGFPTSTSPSSHASVDGDLVCPRVRSISAGALERSDEPDFSRAFPSARYFSARDYTSSQLEKSFNQLFLSRLESMEGMSSDLRLAVAAGATLRRIAINHTIDPAGFRDLLTPELHSLQLHIQCSFHGPSDYLDSLIEISPNLKFLSITLETTLNAYPLALVSAMETLVAAASKFPLTFLGLTYYLPKAESDNSLRDVVFLNPHMCQIFPSLQGLRMTTIVWPWGGVVRSTYWRRAMAWENEAGSEVPFVRVFEEEGEDLERHYEWKWAGE